MRGAKTRMAEACCCFAAEAKRVLLDVVLMSASGSAVWGRRRKINYRGELMDGAVFVLIFWRMGKGLLPRCVEKTAVAHGAPLSQARSS